MPRQTALVQQTDTINAEALATLGGRSALQLSNNFAGITATFLMKRYRIYCQLVGRTLADDGPILVGFAKGDASTTEINSAMTEGNTAGPGDTTQSLTEDESWVVYQNTVHAIPLSGDGTEGTLDTGWMSFGGKNGIPAAEGTGWQVFVYNAGSGALTTGSSVNGIAHTQGVWLRD